MYFIGTHCCYWLAVVAEEEALKNADSVNDLRLKMKMSKLEGNESSGGIDELTSGSSDSGLKI